MPQRHAGRIAVPKILYPGAVEELAWQDDDLVKALHLASNAVLDIIRGHTTHPIWSIFAHWYQHSRTSSLQDSTIASSLFSMAFTFPTFPGLSDHLTPFLLQLEIASRASNRFGSAHHTAVSHIASVLYLTAITRHHLHLQPQHDILIFLLAYEGRAGVDESALGDMERVAYEGSLRRVPTMYEQAYASSVPGVTDTRQLWSDSLGSLVRVADGALCDVTTHTSPIEAVTLHGQPFTFPSTPAGSDLQSNACAQQIEPALPMPRDFARVHAASDMSRPRPKPRIIRPGATAGERLSSAPRTPSITFSGSPLLTIIPLVPEVPIAPVVHARLTRSTAPKDTSVKPSDTVLGKGKRRKGHGGVRYVWVDANGREVDSSESDGGKNA